MSTAVRTGIGKYFLLFAIALALSIFPVVLLISSNSQPCKYDADGHPLGSRMQQYVCATRHQLNSLTHRRTVADLASQTLAANTTATPAAGNAAAAADPAPSPSPPLLSPSPSPSPPLLSPSPSPSPPPTAPTSPSPSPPPTAPASPSPSPPVVSPSPAQSNSAGKKTDDSKANAHDESMHDDAAFDLDGIELPQSDEDVERILNFPHVSECNLCKVCIPQSTVSDHFKAEMKSTEAMNSILKTGDLIEEALSKPAGASRRRLQGSRWGSQPTGLASGGAKIPGEPQEQYLSEAWRRSTSSSMDEFELSIRGMRSRKLLEDNGPDKTRFEIEELDGVYHIQGRDIDLSDIAPGGTKAPERKHLPNCTVCWGCKHTLEYMASGSIMFNNYYAHEPGGSPSWLFRVRTNKTASGWAVVKTWCVPVLKAKQRGFAMCSPKRVFAQIKSLMAQQRVSHECGFEDIVPKVWVEPLLGVVPGNGWRIDWLGLWADVADGVSIQNLQEAGKPKTEPSVLLDLLHNKVRHEEVKKAAIFDLMFSQCDRHQQNLFMQENGALQVIDNDQVYGSAWRRCGIDSLIVPTTQKFMINHLGFFYVLKYPQADPPTKWSTDFNPIALLDYRCHAENHSIGTNLPPQIKKCMTKLAGMTKEAVMLEYGYPHVLMADAVHNRSRDILANGYEWTLLFGEPTNQANHRYKVAPMCCRAYFDNQKNKFFCEDPKYKQMSEIPYGNAWHGGKWHGTEGKDTGTYVGGTEF